MTRMATVALAFFLFFPVASALDADVVTSDGTSVRIERPFSRKRSDFQRAMEIYRERRRQGMTGLVRPTANDSASVEFYLELAFPERESQKKVDPFSTKDYQKKEDEKVTMQEAAHAERMALRRAIRTGTCDHAALFTNVQYQLCVQATQGKEKSRTGGYLPDASRRR